MSSDRLAIPSGFRPITLTATAGGQGWRRMAGQTLANALTQGDVVLDGPRKFPSWLVLSTFAGITPASGAAVRSA